MKKCLHLKKTKPHKRPKPKVQVSHRQRMAAERERQTEKIRLHPASPMQLMSSLMGERRDIPEDVLARLLGIR